MKKMSFMFLVALLTLTLIACRSNESPDATPTPTPEIKTPEITSIAGLEDIEITQHVYFDPLEDVIVLNENQEDITHHITVIGQVEYGRLGSYDLTYIINYGGETYETIRTIDVLPGTINRASLQRNTITQSQINLGAGSYKVGSAPTIDHPISPIHLNQTLLEKAVPSNSWWTSLLVANQGGGNGIYTNPLRSSFNNDGVEITNPGAGFIQYWNPDGYNTMANFSLALPDMFLRTSQLSSGYTTHVIGESDTSVNVALRNNGQKEDLMVLTYAQGSPYVFAEVAQANSPIINLASNGVAQYEFYSVDGIQINGSSYTGAGLVIRLLDKHIGYQTSRPAQVGQPIYGDRYFLITTPEETLFSLSSVNHPNGLLNRIAMTLNGSNIFSVAAIQRLSEAPFYHEHGYTRTLKGDVSFAVDHIKSDVTTTYQLATQTTKGNVAIDPVQFLMPHHYQASTQTLTNYSFQTVRGELKAMIGTTFETTLSFYGLLPAMTRPLSESFSDDVMTGFLNDLDIRNDISDTENFLNDEGPYWNGKAIYPLAQGIIIADQIGDVGLKTSLIAKLRYVLADWFTYEGTTDDRYLYYNEAWGTTYYSNNDFKTASELSDHSFTHGYLVYGSAVLAMYDDTFVDDYGNVVDVLLNDYLYPHKGDYDFAYLRSFDPWAGHTWAHGFGTFAEGNNLESTSEALQSWLAGYLWSLNQNDVDLRDAAIYGFVTELQVAKTYFFDYDQIIFPDNYSNYASVAGLIWGGKYDYATWFGANPTFIYGIHWLPNGEYLSNYATNEQERLRLTQIYNKYLGAKNGTIDTWYANMWSIQAILNPDQALALFNPTLILNDDYPNDLSQTYYLLHGLKGLGQKDTSYHMHIHSRVSSSIYKDDQGVIRVMIWNASDQEETVRFTTPTGSTINITVDPKSFTTHQLS
ncbi:MAG: glycosyl hydrolase [Acholeplasmataceae bacterium]